MNIDSISIHHYRPPLDPPGWTLERRDYILPNVIAPDANAAKVTLPDTPGLGVTIDWGALDRFRFDKGTM